MPKAFFPCYKGTIIFPLEHLKGYKAIFFALLFNLPCMIEISASTSCECEGKANFDVTAMFLLRMFFTRIEHISIVENYLLRICDVKICIAIAFAGSMNLALLLLN